MPDKRITIETDMKSVASVVHILHIFKHIIEDAQNDGQDIEDELRLLAHSIRFLIDASKSMIGDLEEEFKEFISQ